MNSPVQKIKERLSIEEVVSTYIKLDKAGLNLKAKCPFHNEKTPSFFISPSRGGYYCFGCGASGDIFTFVEEFEGLDFRGALKLLADRAGVPLTQYVQETKDEKNIKERLYKTIEEAARYFGNNLSGNPKALAYLKSRGLEEKTIQDFQIGFAEDGWRGLYEKLKIKFSEVELEQAGLIKKTEKGYYDRFRNRIMFPINDSSGRIIAFSGRIFVDDGESAKYLNSPETLIFSKSAILYGMDKAKESIRKNNFSILVEGQLDLILSHQAGYRNTIATSGTALSDSTVSKENVVSNLGLIRRLSPNIVLAFDADKAGFNAANRAGRIALSLGMDVKVASLPDGVDPADLISKNGVDAWRQAIKGSKHIIEFLLEKALKDSGGDARKAGRTIKENILPYVDALQSSIEKMHFIKKISDVASIPESALQDDLKKITQEFKYEKKEIEIAEGSISQVYRKDYILRKLLGIILWQETLVEKHLDVRALTKEVAEILNLAPKELFSKVKDNKGDLIFEAEVFYGENSDVRKDTEELVSNLRGEYLREQLEIKMRELNSAEQAGDANKSARILKECQVLNEKIQDIKNGRPKQ